MTVPVKDLIKLAGPEILPGMLQMSNKNYLKMWIWVTFPAGLHWGSLPVVNVIRDVFHIQLSQTMVYQHFLNKMLPQVPRQSWLVYQKLFGASREGIWPLSMHCMCTLVGRWVCVHMHNTCTCACKHWMKLYLQKSYLVLFNFNVIIMKLPCLHNSMTKSS